MLKPYQGEAGSLQAVDQSCAEGVIPGGDIEG